MILKKLSKSPSGLEKRLKRLLEREHKKKLKELEFLTKARKRILIELTRIACKRYYWKRLKHRRQLIRKGMRGKI